MTIEQIPPNAVIDALTRQDFELFIARTFCQLNPGTKYLPNWHISAIAYHLEQVRKGMTKRLIIAMPPRSLKSIAASVAFPAFIHGHDPTKYVIAISYAQDLAGKLHNDYRAVLRASWYRSAFRGTQIDRRKDTESETLLTGRGRRIASSVGGVLTGRGGDIIIIDDPLKASDGMSEPRRLEVTEWYSNTLISRLDDKQKGAIVIVSQRLHMNDLIGFVQKTGEDWTVLELPAIADRDRKIQISATEHFIFRAGSVLHPEREPLEVLDTLRRVSGSAAFSAQYLQCPTPPGGVMFKRAWVKRHDGSLRLGKGDQILQSWDTASKTGPANDWSVCTTWLKREGCYYLIDVFRERVDYPSLRAVAIELGKRYKPRMILVEDIGIGTGLVADLKRESLNARGIRPEKSKEARASMEAAKFESGRVYFPSSAPWLDELEAELFSFPGYFHDDQVDSISQALAYDHEEGGTRTFTIEMY